MWASTLDTFMDRTILLGNSRIGYELRSRSFSGDLPALGGQVALITGANSGLGKATAAGLARLGAQVHMLVRNRQRGEDARRELAARVPEGEFRLEECDVSRLAAVRRFAEDFRARQPSLHMLVHNAGVLPWQRQVTDEGNEITFATHVLGPFLLTSQLTDPLRAAAPSRVVWVSSSGMYGQRLNPDDPQYETGEYRGLTAYAHTKRMQVVLAEQWAARLAGHGISVHAAHPGWVDSPGLAHLLPRFYRVMKPLLRTPEQGADTFVWLSAAAEAAGTTGRFWHDRAPRPTHHLPWTRETAQDRERLWEACERLTARRAGPAAVTRRCL